MLDNLESEYRLRTLWKTTHGMGDNNNYNYNKLTWLCAFTINIQMCIIYINFNGNLKIS